MTLGWRDQNGQIYAFHSNRYQEANVVEGPYTLTLLVDNANGIYGDLTSTLEVMVDNVVNGTNISCEIFRNHKNLLLFKTGNL